VLYYARVDGRMGVGGVTKMTGRGKRVVRVGDMEVCKGETSWAVGVQRVMKLLTDNFPVNELNFFMEKVVGS
jgi:hypothetical protein